MHTTYCVKTELNNRSCIEFIEPCDPGQTQTGDRTFVVDRQSSFCILTALRV